MSNSEELLNELIEKFIPVINEELPAAIKDAGFDTWEKVAEGSETLGKLNLGICTAKIKAEYKIRDMKNLSTISIKGATLSNIDLKETGEAAAEYKMDMELSSSLKATVKGGIEASCSGLKESVDIKGDIKATKVKGTMKGQLFADLSNGACLVDLKISSLNLSYGDIELDINGLGVFNDFMNELLKAVDAFFGDLIESVIGKSLEPVFENLIVKQLPYCI